MSPKGRPEGEHRSAAHEGSPVNLHESWREEQRSAYLYRACAEAEAGTVRAELFQRLAGEATAQAAIWRAQLTARGHPPPPPYAPDPRARLVARLVRWLGPRRMRPVLSAMKVRGMAVYDDVVRAGLGPAVPTATGAVESRHRNLGGGGNLRAAVFGVNDGLVSNASLILGVAGASGDARLVLMSGVAGLAAGAFAMAAGEYVSVRSQRELFEHQIALERDESQAVSGGRSAGTRADLRGQGPAAEGGDATREAARRRPEHALDTLAREELGLNPAELGSPVGAAARSFLAFAAGAAAAARPVPVRAGAAALPAGVGVTGVALFAIGATLSLFTGRSAWYSGARMLALGGLAGGVTYGIGRALRCRARLTARGPAARPRAHRPPPARHPRRGRRGTASAMRTIVLKRAAASGRCAPPSVDLLRRDRPRRRPPGNPATTVAVRRRPTAPGWRSPPIRRPRRSARASGRSPPAHDRRRVLRARDREAVAARAGADAGCAPHAARASCTASRTDCRA